MVPKGNAKSLCAKLIQDSDVALWPYIIMVNIYAKKNVIPNV